MENKNGKIIAVWGSTGAGKTTLSCQLALALAELKKEVFIVHTDIITPDIPVVMPRLKEQKTMGALWSNPDCSSELILKSSILTKSEHICILGYKAMENVFSYPDYVKENVYRVFTELKNMADYIIVDCVSYFSYNMLSAVALEIADQVIRIGEATLKSFSFFDSNLLMLSDQRYAKEEHIRVLSKIKSFQAMELASGRFGALRCTLEYEEELERMMLEGTILDRRYGGLYGAKIKSLVSLIGDDLNE